MPAATSFVGRRDELARIDALLAQPGCRLLTIIGPGGIGKSRLAAEAIRVAPWQRIRLSRRPQRAVADRAASRAQTRSFAAQRRASRGDGASRSGRSAGADRSGQLRARGRRRRSAGSLARDCPRLLFIVTSRERLETPGEWLVPLEGLAGPRQGAVRAREGDSDAVRLFVERARHSQPDFDVEHELDRISTSSRWSKGMPLMIELAAAWTRLLPCADIVADLRSGLDVLTAAEPLQRAEHASMRASFEHSWSLLLSRERELLGCLTVFRGGFTYPAARHVAGAALPALASLVDKSLLRSSPNGRFSLHQLLHQFASEKFAARPAAEIEVRARHAELFLAMLARPPGNSAANPVNPQSDIDADFENCLAAWKWAVAEPRLDLLEASARAWAEYLESRGRMRRGSRAVRRRCRQLPDAGGAAAIARPSGTFAPIS